MAFEIVGWWPDAHEAMSRLEASPAMSPVVEAINRTLHALERDPYDPRLATTVFRREEYGGVSATPTRFGDWYVFWQPGETDQTLEIVLVHELPVGLDNE